MWPWVFTRAYPCASTHHHRSQAGAGGCLSSTFYRWGTQGSRRPSPLTKVVLFMAPNLESSAPWPMCSQNEHSSDLYEAHSTGMHRGCGVLAASTRLRRELILPHASEEVKTRPNDQLCHSQRCCAQRGGCGLHPRQSKWQSQGADLGLSACPWATCLSSRTQFTHLQNGG